MYLIHPFLIMLMNGIAQRLNSAGDPTIEFVLTLILTLLVCLPMATVMYYLIEKPFIDRSHRKKLQPLTTV